jgi:short-subunit dehydrogenase
MFTTQYGPWAVIAGGSDGIGAAFAREAAVRGLNLVIVARRAGPLEDLARELRTAHPKIEVRTHSIDLGEENAIEMIKTATEKLEVGTLIYNAGAESRFGPFLDHDWALLRNRLERNFFVKAALVHHFGRLMRSRKRGGIILMGSTAGFAGSPGFTFYASSKAFTHNLAEGLWYELQADNINLLCPIVGPTRTPTMINSYGPMDGHATEPDYIAKGAFERIGNGPIWISEDIAEGVKAMIGMEPANRATLMAQRAAEFARKMHRDEIRHPQA